MSDQDEVELTEAFKELTAPRSTANYAQRTPAVEVQSTGSRWPQALASVLAVVIALAGAGTFLALRNARQNNLATAAGGNPPARSGAAMAYDSAAGVTVMYGGMGATENVLHDTWLWNGTTWSALAQSGGPGPMVDVHMSDDPHDGGVLLIGMPEVPIANGSGSGTISGCVIGATGSGSANAGTAIAGPPTSVSGAPGATTIVPSAVATPGSVPPATPAIPPSPCPVVIAPTAQTWILDSSGWHRVDAGSKATMPSANAQLAYDSASGDVLAVATTYYPCGAPLGTGTTKQPQIACESPLASGVPSSSGTGSTGSSGSAAPQVCTVKACPIATAPCPMSAAIYTCGGGGSVSTWMWSGGHWITRPTNIPAGVAALVAASAANGQHATLLLDTWGPFGGCQGPASVCASPLTAPVLQKWQWSSSGWAPKDSGMVQGGGVFNLVGSSSFAAVDGKVLAVALDGSVSVLDLSSSSVAPAGSVTPRSGEAIAEGPANTVVLFGGAAVPTGAVAGYRRASVGSDTWSWHSGAGWQHLTGSVPPPPTPCPTAAKTGPGCVEILPAQVPPATSAVPGAASTLPAAASATP
jgi:hypothetical protein